MVRRGFALVALAALGACGSFEDPTRVIDLRVLGIEADRPELVLDFDPEHPEDLVPQLEASPITLRALVADPADARRLEWDLAVCPPTETLRCDDPGATVVKSIGHGTVADPETAFEPPTGTFTVPLDVLMESIRADSLAGFGGVAVQVQLQVWPQGDRTQMIYAAKRVVVAPRLPAQRVPNVNPTLESLLVDEDENQPLQPGRCGDPATTPLAVVPEQEVVLLPVEPEGVRETYVLPTFEGGVRTIVENLRYSWFTTAGSFSAGQTGGPTDGFGNKPPLDSTWRAPEEPGEVRLWLVQRDERGGLAWTEYCARVGAP